MLIVGDNDSSSGGVRKERLAVVDIKYSVFVVYSDGCETTTVKQCSLGRFTVYQRPVDCTASGEQATDRVSSPIFVLGISHYYPWMYSRRRVKFTPPIRMAEVGEVFQS